MYTSKLHLKGSYGARILLRRGKTSAHAAWLEDVLCRIFAGRHLPLEYVAGHTGVEIAPVALERDDDLPACAAL